MEVILAEPRGFCAGVRRAILIVEKAIQKFGTPIYVKHEIVHNKIVIESLKSKGVIFTDEVSQIPQGSVVIYSAHGVSDAVESEAERLQLIPIDATCPLVKKVHKEVIQYDEEGFQIILIGHKNHPEIEGTSGKLKKGKAIIVQNVEEAKTVQIENDQKLAIATQTTLSLDDTKEIIEILEARFPVLKGNVKNDICYATQNRQTAVYDLIQNYQIDGLIVVGSQNSSNSNRLKDIGTQRGIPSFLINEPDELDLKNVLNLKKIGITAGASAPEHLIEKLVDFFKKKDNNLKITIMDGVKEDTVFHLPKQLRD
jgi:4-hydroxy-3-methylbut-2-enyl diphosphate reductase